MFPTAHGVVSQGGRTAPAGDFDNILALAPMNFWLADNVSASNGDPVSSVPDDGDLGIPLTASSTARPTFSAAGGPNGRACLQFNGTSNYLTGGTTASWKWLHSSVGSTTFVVYKINSAASNALHVLMDTSGVTGANVGVSVYHDDRTSVPRSDRLVSLVGNGTGGSTLYRTGETIDEGFPGATWQVAVVRVDGVLDYLHKGGVSIFRNGLWRQQTIQPGVTPGGSASTSNSAYALHVGRRASASTLWLAGDVAAIITFDSALDAGDIYGVLQDLSAYYALPLHWPLRAVDLDNTSHYDIGSWGYRHTDGVLRAYSGRLSNHNAGDGDIYKFTSSDQGASWSDALVLDHGAGDGLRNLAGGVVPSTGTVLVFYAAYDGSDFSDLRVMRSTNHGVTFSDEGSLTSVLTQARYSPYGPLVELPSGKLLQTFYEHNSSAQTLLFTLESTDDGLTWGNRVNINSLAVSGIRVTEAAIIHVSGATDGASVLLCVARQPTTTANGNGTYLRQFSSSDGGATWSDDGDITSTTSDINVSPWLAAFDGTAYLAWMNRTSDDLFVLSSDPGDAVGDPSAWSSQVSIYRQTGGAAEDCGYPSLLSLNGQSDRLAALLYDSRGTNNTNLVIAPVPR